MPKLQITVEVLGVRGVAQTFLAQKCNGGWNFDCKMRVRKFAAKNYRSSVEEGELPILRLGCGKLCVRVLVLEWIVPKCLILMALFIKREASPSELIAALECNAAC